MISNMAASNSGAPFAIHDSDTASGSEENTVEELLPVAPKRKAAESISEKVYLSDDDGLVPTKPKRRQRRKSGKKIDKTVVNDDGSGSEDDAATAGLPDYVLQRRQQFEADRKSHHTAALMVPPSYFDIDLDESSLESPLKKRPEFPESSGIKPSRPCQDIELPQSAGIIPASIAQYLRDYQVEGVKFLHRKFVYQEGAILGDDMGLGKTVQVVAFLTAAFGKTGDERDRLRLRQLRFTDKRWYPRILIVCPGSLIMNWKNELDRWGWWQTGIYHGTNKDDALLSARAGMLEILITTYETYKNGRSSINMVQWDAIIADECHRLKDRSSETTKALNEVNALCRIGLTGTAIQNKYEELWTILDWTNPGHFGTRAEWSQTISKVLTVGQSHEATNAQLSLARQTARKLVENLLPKFFLRRMKSLIAHQLPKKTDRVVFCPLSDQQSAAYKRFVESDDIMTIKTISETCEHEKKRGWCCGTHTADGKRWQSIVFPAIMTLQKLSNHLTLLLPNTLDLSEKHKSELKTLKTCLPDTWEPLYANRDKITNLAKPEFCGKWKVLKKLLKFWHGNGDKVLVFSHSVRLLNILRHLFTNTSYSTSFLDGSVKYEERQALVDTFNSDPTQFVFLISTKAGGVGLNITSANKVVIIDPHWNPAYDLQAQDRAYRIGQTRDVEVFRLVSLGTVEEVVYARQIYKQQQANIGYTASSERRYFKGVQQDAERKGEIFGLHNIFTYHSSSGLLRDIVNKTNIAEAKAGVSLVDVDMEKAAKDEDGLGSLKKEEDNSEDGGISQLAALLTSENQQQMLESRKANVPKSDAILAILTSAGVEYTHDNAEVIGSSKVEEELSKRAEMRLYTEGDAEGSSALFASEDTYRNDDMHTIYQPSSEICLRQFSEMAREFGFINATEFALIVESWSQEARTNCLDTFYKRRKKRLANNKVKEEVVAISEPIIKDEGIKPTIEDPEVKSEGVKPEIRVKNETSLDVLAVKKENIPSSVVKAENEGESKRQSIFLIDDDDDDEL